MKPQNWILAVVAFVGLPLAFSLVIHFRNQRNQPLTPESMAFGVQILRSRVEVAQAEVRDKYLEIKKWNMTRGLERRRRILRYVDLQHMDIKAAGEKAVDDEETEMRALLLDKDLLELEVRERQAQLERFLRPDKP